MVPLWIAFITVIHFHLTLSLTGNNVCEIEETYRINVTEIVPRNLTFRHYRWCLNMPPRCSYYTRKEITEQRIVEKESQRTVQVCCPGYVEENNTCTINCSECRNKFCTNSSSVTSYNTICLQNASSQICSNSGCHGDCTSFETSCREFCQCPLDRNGERCSNACKDKTQINTDLVISINSTDPTDFSSVDEATPSPSVSQSVITEENTNSVETVSKKNVTTLSNQRGHLGNVSQLPVRILYERLNGTTVNGSNSAIPLLANNKKTMMDDDDGDGDGDGGSNKNNTKRVMSTSAEAGAGGPMTLHVRDKKTKEEQGSVGTTPDVDSEPVTVMQETAAGRRHTFVVPLLKAKAANDMEVSGSGATTTPEEEEEKGKGLRHNISTIIGMDTVVGGGFSSLPTENVDNGDGRVLFYVLLTLTGIGMTISAIVAAVFIIKFKYGRKNDRDSSACCKVHFTKKDNNNSCNVAVNADCTNVNSVFQGVVSPDLLQHQGTLPKGLTFSTVPELVDFSVKFSSNVCEKYSSSENVYDEIRSCKDDPTFSSFYVNFNSSNNTTYS